MRSRETLPVRDPDDLALDTRGERTVHGVVLAAGQSIRYGPENKLLEPLDGTPLVAHAVGTAVDSAVAGVTVVVGYEADTVRDALDGFDVAFRTNESYADGQSTSLACGVAAARGSGADAVVVLLGDMPHVSVATVDLLLAAYAGSTYDALAAAFEGKRGNPVLFDGVYFDALADVEGDVGGREILLEHADAVAVETGDPGVLRDVDRPTDR